jgi:cytochrome P450
MTRERRPTFGATVPDNQPFNENNQLFNEEVLVTGIAVDELVDVHNPEDIVDAVLNRQFLSVAGDDAPWDVYRAMREHSPAYWSEKYQLWYFTGWKESLATLLHNHVDLGVGIRRAAAEGDVMSEVFAPTMLYFENPHDTLRQRKLVREAFTHHQVASRRGLVQDIVNEHLDAIRGRTSFDVMNDFADHIPVAVVCGLLGVPREDVPQFRDWTRIAGSGVAAAPSEETRRKVNEAFTGLRDYITGLIARHRREDHDDLLSLMIRARDEEDRLSEEELIGLSIFILAAGSDTTTQLITGMVRSLDRFPDQFRALRQDRTLMANAIEECLRLSGPTHYTLPRLLTADLEVDGTTFKQGEAILCSVAGANRDPQQWENPDTLDIRREGVRHLGFSQGMHLCIGAMFARLEGEVAMAGLLDTFDDIVVDQDELEFIDYGPIRGIASLQVSTTPAKV